MQNSAPTHEPRRGLVIEGGGAKGAYGLGCLIALWESRIRFDAVAGTSVGGLLAAIWSSGRLSQAVKMWTTPVKQSEIEFKRPLLLSFLGSILYVPFRVLASQNSVYIIAHTLALNTWCLVVFGMFYLLGGVGRNVVAYMLLAFLILDALVFGITFLVKKQVSILNNQALKRHLDELFDGAEFTVPTFVTLCDSRETVDPDRPFAERGLSDDFLVETYNIFPLTEFVPVYKDLGSRYTDEARLLLLATAALPFGLISPVAVNGHFYSDGGLADNVPFSPLINTHGYDEIFVVHLRPRDKIIPRLNDEARQKYWQELERRVRIVKLGRAEAKAMYFNQIDRRHPFGYWFDPPLSVPFHCFEGKWPLFVDIAPERSLGGLLKGTLNFSPSKILRLVKQGRLDTASVLERYFLANNSSAP